MYYDKKHYCSTTNPEILRIQKMINNARKRAYRLVEEDKNVPGLLNNRYYFQSIHHRNFVDSSWKKIDEDGRYGDKTELAVKCLQNFLFLDVNGAVGDTTYASLQKLLNVKLRNDSVLYGGSNSASSGKSISKKNHIEVKKIASGSLSGIKSVDSLHSVFMDIHKNICQQFTNVNTFKVKIENTRFKHVDLSDRRELASQVEMFMKHAGIHGIKSAVLNNAGKINKAKLINYMNYAVQVFKNSKLVITVESISKAIEPFTKILSKINKIPGFKWAGVIEKLCTGTKRLFWDHNPTQALSLFCNALREAFEQIIVDAAIAALIASGLGLLALALVIILMIIDYFLFSDNPGDSLVDKYTHLHTYNLVDKIVEGHAYAKIPQVPIQRGVGIVKKP